MLKNRILLEPFEMGVLVCIAVERFDDCKIEAEGFESKIAGSLFLELLSSSLIAAEDTILLSLLSENYYIGRG